MLLAISITNDYSEIAAIGEDREKLNVITLEVKVRSNHLSFSLAVVLNRPFRFSQRFREKQQKFAEQRKEKLKKRAEELEYAEQEQDRDRKSVV